jgi:hypothetical protein
MFASFPVPVLRKTILSDVTEENTYRNLDIDGKVMLKLTLKRQYCLDYGLCLARSRVWLKNCEGGNEHSD